MNVIHMVIRRELPRFRVWCRIEFERNSITWDCCEVLLFCEACTQVGIIGSLSGSASYDVSSSFPLIIKGSHDGDDTQNYWGFGLFLIVRVSR
jgi:hypothetical protein